MNPLFAGIDRRVRGEQQEDDTEGDDQKGTKAEGDGNGNDADDDSKGGREGEGRRRLESRSKGEACGGRE